MLGFERNVIAHYERALVFEDRRLKRVLQPGVHWVFNKFGRVRVEIVDVSNSIVYRPKDFAVLKSNVELFSKDFEFVSLNDREVGLVFLDGVFNMILEPATKTALWKSDVELKVEVVDISESYAVSDKLVPLLVNSRDVRIKAFVRDYVLPVEVADFAIGLLFVDGHLEAELKSGTQAFWKFNRDIKVDYIDTRIRTVEVSGQEILSKDKVSLRVNLTAQYRISDPALAKRRLNDVADFLYKELQLILRASIGTRSLDALLGNKGELDESVFISATTKLAEFGIELHSAGVKDIILPGEMKTILNQVVEAEKAAQANVIKRREETAATRSLLNTAKLMETNPTLLRLKELETLEKVTEKVDKLTVFGGLEGVLQDTVRINVAQN